MAHRTMSGSAFALALFALLLSVVGGFAQSVTPACGSTLTSSTGTISMTSYTPNMQCSWTIAVSGASLIRFTWSNFNTEQQFDYVTLRQSSGALLGTFSGQGPQPAVLAVGSSVVVAFQSDSSVQLTGFTLSYEADLTSFGSSFDLSGTGGTASSNIAPGQWQYYAAYYGSTSSVFPISLSVVGGPLSIFVSNFTLPTNTSFLATQSGSTSISLLWSPPRQQANYLIGVLRPASSSGSSFYQISVPTFTPEEPQSVYGPVLGTIGGVGVVGGGLLRCGAGPYIVRAFRCVWMALLWLLCLEACRGPRSDTVVVVHTTTTVPDATPVPSTPSASRPDFGGKDDPQMDRNLPQFQHQPFPPQPYPHAAAHSGTAPYPYPSAPGPVGYGTAAPPPVPYGMPPPPPVAQAVYNNPIYHGLPDAPPPPSDIALNFPPADPSQPRNP